jgi:hypothetical protein
MARTGRTRCFLFAAILDLEFLREPISRMLREVGALPRSLCDRALLRRPSTKELDIIPTGALIGLWEVR